MLVEASMHGKKREKNAFLFNNKNYCELLQEDARHGEAFQDLFA